MTVRKITGMTLAVGTTLGASKNMTAVTNANPGVATLEASHGIVLNDIMFITSGWPRLNNRVIKAGTPSTNDIPLTGVNTTSTTDYPAGEGVGSIKEVTGWTSITGLRYDGVQGGGGGGFEFGDTTEVTDIRRQQVPLLAQAVSLQFGFNWDPDASWFSTLLDVARAGSTVPLRWVFGGKTIYFSGIVAVNSFPNPQGGIAQGSLAVSVNADEIVY